MLNAISSPVRLAFRKGMHAARRNLAFTGGLLGAAVVAFAAGEMYLRVAPPSDLVSYLPDNNRHGPFQNDPKFGVQYQSLEALAADNPGRLDPYRSYFNNPSAPPTWAFFGSSFAQAPGMLVDTTRQFVPQRVTFNLGKNEPFPVRLAQAAFLLDNGLKPERILHITIPLDMHSFAIHGLDQYRATENGGLAYAPRLPSVGGGLVQHSRLALKGWTRTTLHLNRPFYVPLSLFTRIDPAVRTDLRTVFTHLSEVTAKHRVPVTLVLLPSYEQVLRGAGFAVQDVFAEEARAVGFDVCDTRAAFLAWPDKPGLFIPDKHFSATGNRLLLATIIDHLKRTDLRAADLPDSAGVRP